MRNIMNPQYYGISYLKPSQSVKNFSTQIAIQITSEFDISVTVHHIYK